jgi:hypothetical protein
VERDSVVSVLRALLQGPVSWSRGLLAGAIAVAIALAITVLWLLVVELTRFYFHANHVQHGRTEVFTPRFTLTGLRIPSDEFGPETDAEYEAVHGQEATVRLLVPGNARARGRIDRQLNAYPGLVQPGGDPDRRRAEGLFELAASKRRLLVEEVAKVEYGMVRHMLRLQVIVLRYVKALLVIVVTALTAFACAAAVNSQAHVTAADERWIASALLIWAPVVLLAVSSPVHWLESLLRAEGAQQANVIRDHELTQLEEVTARLAGLTWALAAVALVLLVVHHHVSHQGVIAVAVVAAASGALGAAWAARRFGRRAPAG